MLRLQYKRSSSHKVFLKNVALKSSGKITSSRRFSSREFSMDISSFPDIPTTGIYKCEVSLEGPSFSSVQSESYMLVVCRFKISFSPALN